MSEPAAWWDWVGFTTHWQRQREILRSVRDNQRTAVRSGHGVGKTRAAAGVGLWFLFNFYPSRVITTAPTGRQIELLLWGEVRRLHAMMERTLREKRNIPEIGDYLLPKACRLFLDGQDEDGQWYAIGFSTDQPEAFTGLHEVNILFVVDEASGVDHAIFDAIEGSLNTPNSRILAIGNPTDPGSYFGRVFLTREGSDWHKIHISCLESPNVRAGRNVIPGLCGWDWPAHMLKKWGQDDPRYLIKVLGEFPERSANALVSYPVAYAAYSETLALRPEAKLILAIDVARYGDDLSVLLLREKGTKDYDGAYYEPEEDWKKPALKEKYTTITKQSNVEEDKEELAAVIAVKISKSSVINVAAEAVRLLEKYPGQIEDIAVDVVGVGAGTYDMLEQSQYEEDSPLKGITLWAVAVGEGAADKEHCFNLRAEIHRAVKEDIENEVLLYSSEDIVDQVSTMPLTYEPKRGRLLIWPKDEFKKKYGRSPDELDALAISYAPRVLRARGGEPRIRSL